MTRLLLVAALLGRPDAALTRLGVGAEVASGRAEAIAVMHSHVRPAIASPRRSMTRRVRPRVAPPVVTANLWNTAIASEYGNGDGFLGGHLACGGRLDAFTFVVAHKWLPCGTRVTFAFRGRVVTATVRDRGPYVAGRTWDFGPAVARALHFPGLGIVAWRFADGRAGSTP